MTPEDGRVLHASAVAIAGSGVLIIGPSGSGKSTVALDFISRGAVLISDDRVVASGTPPRLSPPETIAGLIEARGIGLLKLPYEPEHEAVLVIDMGRTVDTRIPQCTMFEINSVCLPLIAGANNPTLVPAVIAGLSTAERFPLYDGGIDGAEHERDRKQGQT